MNKAWLIGGAAFLVLLTAAAIVSVAANGEADLDEGTPEAAVQRLLQAVEAEDHRAAYDLLSEELKGECAYRQFVSETDVSRQPLRDERISLARTRTDGSDAYVTVRVSSIDRGGLFGGYEYSYEERFTLTMEEGAWRFSDYPWPLRECDWRSSQKPYHPARYD